MKGFLLIAVMGVLMACSTGPKTDLKAGQRYSILYTAASRKAEGIFPVVIYSIDGRELNSDRQFHKIEPGLHSIKARGIVDRDWVPGLKTDRSRENNTPLTFHFESGTRYFIGLKASSSRRADWELVVWKVEEVEAGVLGFD